MTTRAQLTAAMATSQELDQVSAAIAALQPGVTPSVVVEISIPGAAAFRITVNPTVAALTTLLTNRQTALQNALTAAGITG